MKTEKLFTLLLALVLLSFSSGAKGFKPDESILYKVIDGDSLYLKVFKPQKTIEPTAAIVFFFGGGWTGGTPKQFYQQSEYLASRGILAISANYRVKNIHGTTPFDCVEDGKSAIRWIREHAKELNIDPNKVVASGGSAGGHIALCTALIDGFENANEDLSISSVPNAIIAYNPVYDTTKKGYGHEKVAGRETEISPYHQAKKNMPPILLFHGKADTTVPFENATRFTAKMQELGNDCNLVAFESVGHGFFNGDFFRQGSGNKYFNLCMYDSDVFLTKLGYLKGKPTLSRDLKQLSCIGDSNTQKQYPDLLQEELGSAYQVKNFGKGGATLIDGSLFPYQETKAYKRSLKFKADVVLIMMGTNDANPKWCIDTERKTDFEGSVQEEFKSEYLKLIAVYQKQNPQSKIYLLSPLPVWAKKKPDNKNLKGRKEQLNKWVLPLVQKIAKEKNFPFIDVHKLMRKGFKYTTDGVHLNEEGYQILARKIACKIK